MDDSVNVKFGADASELLAALDQINGRLNTTSAGIAQFGTRATNMNRQVGNQTKQMTKEWQSALQPIDRAFSQSVSGIIRGTQTIHQAESKAAQSLLISYIDLAEKKLTHWIASELGSTMATQAGVDARSAAQASGNDSDILSMAAAALKKIATSAAEAFAGVFAFLAPSTGPAAAAPAAMAQMSVLAVASDVATAAGGMWEVPGTMLATIHERESILPARIAEPMRNFFTGGGSGGTPDIHMHFHTIDGRSGRQFLLDHKHDVAESMRQAWRNANPHLR